MPGTEEATRLLCDSNESLCWAKTQAADARRGHSTSRCRGLLWLILEQSESTTFTRTHWLKAGGKFLFLEHGLSPEPKVQKWQHRLNWLQRRLAGGCHLDRDMRALVSAQPFASLEIDEFYIEKTPRTHGYLYRGVATK
jgi:hypothetical protein